MSNLPERRRMFVGASFGRFVVTACSPGSLVADVTCQCGTTRTVQRRHLLSGASKSCGCLHREVARSAKNGLTHGEGADDRRSPEYISWNGMLQRCLNPKAANFHLYGGRGIGVCDAWRKFEGFLADMGRRPTRRHTLDRIDVDGNYEPGNCRWADKYEQAANRRTTKIGTLERDQVAWLADAGYKYQEIADYFGVSPSRISAIAGSMGRRRRGSA